MSVEAAGDERRFVDTNVFVYAYDQSAGRKHDIARDLIVELWGSRAGCLSVQVLQELFVALTREIPRPLSAREAGALIEDFTVWPLHAPTARDVFHAIHLHERTGTASWDAMILTSARSLGCRILYSEDLNAGQRYEGVLVVNPFAPSS